MASVYRQSLDDWLGGLDVKTDTLLDIGGAQNPLKGRTKSWDVKEYHIVDLDSPHVEKTKPDFVQDISYPLVESLARNVGLIDMVFCLEVFEYVWSPLTAFHNIATLLKPSGVAWASFPFVYPIHQPVEHDCLRYTESAVRKLAAAVGLRVDEVIYRRPKSHKLVEYYAEDGLRAARGIDHSVIGYIVRFTK